MVEPNTGQLTRRGFLSGLGTSLAGLTVVGFTGCSIKDQAVANPSAEPSAKSAPAKYPFAYVKLDPDKAAERTYKAYFKGS